VRQAARRWREPGYPALHPPTSARLDTLRLPFAVAAELGFVLQGRGGN
jgi:uncharacterized protein YceK